jgi:UDP-N-acetylmuramate-alanine ligase
VRSGDVVVVMGAGDITKTASELLARLRRAA